jgi:hypothetical protein
MKVQQVILYVIADFNIIGTFRFFPEI